MFSVEELRLLGDEELLGLDLSDAELGRIHGVTRQAVRSRRLSGWSELELRRGFRSGVVGYGSKLDGLSVKEWAVKHGVSLSTAYRRVRSGGCGG